MKIDEAIRDLGLIKNPFWVDAVGLAIEALKQIQSYREEEIQFLDQILHLPFFEFCLQVKERKERLEAEYAK